MTNKSPAPQRMSDSDFRAIVKRVDALPVHEFHCYYPELENRQFVELKDIQAAIHPDRSRKNESTAHE